MGAFTIGDKNIVSHQKTSGGFIMNTILKDYEANVKLTSTFWRERQRVSVVILPLHNPVWKQVILDSPVLQLRSIRIISVEWV